MQRLRKVEWTMILYTLTYTHTRGCKHTQAQTLTFSLDAIWDTLTSIIFRIPSSDDQWNVSELICHETSVTVNRTVRDAIDRFSRATIRIFAEISFTSSITLTWLQFNAPYTDRSTSYRNRYVNVTRVYRLKRSRGINVQCIKRFSWADGVRK